MRFAPAAPRASTSTIRPALQPRGHAGGTDPAALGQGEVVVCGLAVQHNPVERHRGARVLGERRADCVGAGERHRRSSAAISPAAGGWSASPSRPLAGITRATLALLAALPLFTALPLLIGCGGGSDAKPTAETVARPADKPLPSAQALADRYVAAKGRVEAGEHVDPAKGAAVTRELTESLRDVVQYAEDTHLRVNAALLLSTVASERKDHATALAWTREAKALLPDEPLVRRAHALTLAGDGRFAEAIPEQEFVVKDDPDDLASWLLLGELNVKAGRSEDAVLAYAAYEARRKGLLDGLTLKKDGQYVAAPADRASCALALVPAADGGTALGLLYALESEPEVAVRMAIVEAMALQRLGAYLQPLTKREAIETDAELVKLLDDAIAEIERDPIDAAHGPVPEGLLPAADAAPTAPGAAPEGPPSEGTSPLEAGQGSGDAVDPGRASPPPADPAPARE
jgi:tetratricopeptide (TPR) repeat protein